ncbi:hypothetical protein [Quadrisphaera sp. KR29]|uniref:hypothetical protein n=1 Tax=Quadrisphaera sp. KR29 TaxID=3461391 RepID=UPI004044FC5B
MPRVPGENNGLGAVSAAVGLASLLLGVVVPLLLLGGFPGIWLAVRARRRVIDGDASNPRTVLVGFFTSAAAAALFLVLLTIGVLRSAGVVGG